MSATAPIEPDAARDEPDEAPGVVRGTPGWCVRAARPQDVGEIAAAVAELLAELDSPPPPASAMCAAVRALLGDGDAGAVLVAETDGALVGVIAASWQTAIHVPGRYGLIQDLWVSPSWRGNAIGAALLEALCERARREGIERIEVGLPREGFASLGATAAFYRRNGFASLGARMRMVLP
jgi:GNAT superfamily N-acetyltransferase